MGAIRKTPNNFMVDDLAVVILVSADDVAKCYRLIEIQAMLHRKFLEAREELDRFLIPEVLK